MRFVLTFISALAVFTLAMPTAQAQDYGRMFEDVSELNVSNPTRDPRFDTLEEILKRRIQDKKNKVVGEVTGILVDDRGTIEAVRVNFNRLRLSNEIALDYNTTGIRGISNAYILELYEDDQIEELFPTLLANMQTAAGQEDVFDAQRIVGATVKSENGKVLGKVNTLLFDNSGDRVRALYVDMKAGNYRGANIAIPFSGIEYDLNNRYRDIVLSEQQAQAVTDYIESE